MLNTAARIATEREKATRRRLQVTTRWEDPPGNLKTANTTNCKKLRVKRE